MNKRDWRWAVLLVPVVLLAACGGDNNKDDDENGSSDDPTEITASTTSTTLESDLVEEDSDDATTDGTDAPSVVPASPSADPPAPPTTAAPRPPAPPTVEKAPVVPSNWPATSKPHDGIFTTVKHNVPAMWETTLYDCANPNNAFGRVCTIPGSALAANTKVWPTCYQTDVPPPGSVDDRYVYLFVPNRSPNTSVGFVHAGSLANPHTQHLQLCP